MRPRANMKPRRSSRLPKLAFAVLLLTLAGAVAACGGEEATTSTAGSTAVTAGESSTTAAPDAATYTDATYGFSFKYPKDWELSVEPVGGTKAGEEASNSMGVYDPEGTQAGDVFIDGVIISVYKLNIVVDEATVGELRPEVEQSLISLEEQRGDMQVVEDLQQITLNGMPGFQITYSLTNEGVPSMSQLVFLFREDTEYLLTVQAAEATWESNQENFELILSTFTAPQV